jgi:para-nitrobenzyl esterase
METVVETSKGKLKGTKEWGLSVFRGIPFARPPVGDLRFRAPQPLEPWQGVRDATSFGPTAMQIPNEALESLFGRRRQRPPMDEDCLYLNVWTPAADAGQRPVMVWIHGGGFTIGTGSEPLYYGNVLVSRDVVVVTINYRLGALGFLYVPDFVGADDEFCTNFGMLDQVAALEWVRDEIAAFGGDPGNVTIFGESAGAMSIATLMASPLATNLFRRAVLQSGAAHNALTTDQAEANATAFAEALDMKELTAGRLRSMPVAQILGAQARMDASDRDRAQEGRLHGLRFQPVVDGRFLPAMPIDAIRRGCSRDVPVLIGTTAEEAKLFAAMWPGLARISDDEAARRIGWLVSPDGDTERGRAMLQVYRDARAARGEATGTFEVFLATQTDLMFRIPADRLAEAQAAHLRQVFAYRFDWRSPIANGALGACHALDLPFVFGTHRLVPAFAGESPDADTLATTVGDAWVAFARTGDPSTDALHWPAFDAGRRNTIILDRECRVEELPRETERRCWDGIIA